MEQKNFKCEIMSFDKTVFSGEIISLIAPGEMGQFGILANHAPMISLLKEGIILLKNQKGEEKFEIKKGILEVQKNSALIFVTI